MSFVPKEGYITAQSKLIYSRKLDLEEARLTYGYVFGFDNIPTVTTLKNFAKKLEGQFGTMLTGDIAGSYYKNMIGIADKVPGTVIGHEAGHHMWTTYLTANEQNYIKSIAPKNVKIEEWFSDRVGEVINSKTAHQFDHWQDKLRKVITDVIERIGKVLGVGSPVRGQISQWIDEGRFRGKPREAALSDQATDKDDIAFLKKGFSTVERDNLGDLLEISKINEAYLNIRQWGQSSVIKVRKLQERLKKAGYEITEDINPEMAQTLYYGRVATRQEMVDKKAEVIVKHMVDLSKKNKLDTSVFQKQANDYLIARHAPERNAALYDGAAGITTAEAKKVIAEVENSPLREDVLKVANLIQKMNNEILDVLYQGKETDVITEDLYKTLRDKYKNHIPLNRVLEEEDVVTYLQSRGLSVKGTGIKRAKGSDLQVDDILGNVTANYKSAIARAEKNIVDNTTWHFAREYKELGIFKEVGPQLIPAKIEAREVIDPVFTDQLRAFAENLGATFQTKGKPGKILGTYQKAGQLITRTLTTPREIQAHETGHFLDHKFELKQRFYKRGDTKNVAIEMLRHMENRGESVNRMNSASERFADSFEWWLTHRDLAKQELPLFSKQIESIIKEIDELKPLLNIKQSAGFSVRKTKETIFVPSPIMTDPNVLTFRRFGEPVYLKISPEFAPIYQMTNRETLSGTLRWVGSLTRFYASLATSKNLEFAPSNILRDMQEMLVYLSSQEGGKVAGKAALKTPKSVRSVLDYVRGKDTEGSRLYQQMKLDGGTTGGMALSTRAQIDQDIEKLFKAYKSSPKRFAKAVLRSIDSYNTIFEDSTRLSVYKAALEAGKSRKNAAYLAKKSTVDFDEKGTAGPIVNALYMFSNASIQGSTKMLRSMKNPKVAAATVSTVSSAVIAAALYNDDKDEKWREKVTKWDKNNSLIIVTQGGDDFQYIKIPVSWGLKPIKISSDYVADITLGKKTDPTEMLSGIFGSIIEGYNPLGGTDLISAITPTALGGDIIMDLARNKRWSGSMIKPDWLSGLSGPEQIFKTTPETLSGRMSIKLSEGVRTVGVTVSPESIKYAYEQLIGGAGRFMTKTINSGVGAVTGSVPKADEFPFIGRFYSEREREEIQKTIDSNRRKSLLQELQKQKTQDERVRIILEYLSGRTREEKQKILFQVREGGIDTTGISYSDTPRVDQDVDSILEYRRLEKD